MGQQQDAWLHPFEANPMEKTSRFGRRLGQGPDRSYDSIEHHRFFGIGGAKRKRRLDLQRVADSTERVLTDHRCAAPAQVMKTVAPRTRLTHRIVQDPDR